tara:strand:- start:4279 stop:5136 length:858 start_codon:yes stop_codon:yes gene_type:complete
MKISAFLSYTDNKQKQPWHDTNYECLSKYFKRYNISLYTLKENDPLLANCIEAKVNSKLFDILRINKFVETNTDYGIFLDLNTSIINIHQDIHKVLDYDTQYFAEAECKDLNKDLYLTIDELCKSKIAFQKSLSSDHEKFVICNSAFMCLSKDFCEDFISFLKAYDMDISNKNHIVNLLKNSQSKDITDEFLLESFLNHTMHNYEISNLHEKGVNQIILDNSTGVDDTTLEEIMYFYPIFFRHGDISEHTKYFVKNGLLTETGLEKYNNIRHLRYSEMFFKYHSN